MGPSAPRPPRCSSSDHAKDRDAQQARMELHLRSQAWKALARMAGGSCLTFAFANWPKKFWHSPDHRPPTSQAKTTNRARPLAPESSGYVVSLRRLARTSAAPSTLAHCGPGCHHSSLETPWWCRWPIARRGKAAIRLQRPQDVSGHGTQVEITDPHVECDPAPSFPAHSRRSTLKCKASPTQNSRRRTR